MGEYCLKKQLYMYSEADAPVHSNVRAVHLRHATGIISRPPLRLMTGHRSRTRSAINVVQEGVVVVAPVITVLVFVVLPNETQLYEYA